MGRVDAVILAGGSGQRFWPLSRELSPKQMLTVFGSTSLVSQAVHRVAPFVAHGAIHVVTSERLHDELRNHLLAQEGVAVGRELDFVVEPGARNTAPALALAAAIVVREDPDAMLVMLPSDHLIAENEAWRRTIAAGISAAQDGSLVTVGLVPTHPATGYGYIHRGEPAAPDGPEGLYQPARVRSFVEKPDEDLAASFVAGGEHLWNSGMLIARADAILSELRSAGRMKATERSSAGELIADAAEELAAMPATERLTDATRSLYGSLPAVSFDHAALEVSDRVLVIPSDLEWSDVGDLRAIEKLAAPDDRGNVVIGHALAVDSDHMTVYAPDRLVATLGVSDLMVVDTDDALLVAPRDRAQDVRLVVDVLAASGAPEIVESRESLRPWGSWRLLLEGPGYRVKRILVRPGMRLSLQSHEHRSEHWVVIAGSAFVECDGSAFEVPTGESAFIPVRMRHRLQNRGEEDLVVVEVAVGEYLSEDDIVRYDDDFGRGDEAEGGR